MDMKQVCVCTHVTVHPVTKNVVKFEEEFVSLQAIKVYMAEKVQRNPSSRLAVFVDEKLASGCVPNTTTASGSSSY
jgi:hypothetical protein